MKTPLRITTSLCLFLFLTACGSGGDEGMADGGTTTGGGTTDGGTTGNGTADDGNEDGGTTGDLMVGTPTEPCEGNTSRVWIDEDLTLSNNIAGPDYIITCRLEIIAGTLTIEPETEILFEQNTSLVIEGTAEIRALGGYDGELRRDPSIIMRGNSVSGLPSWNGVKVRTASIDNYMENVEILDAGSQKIEEIFFPQDASALLIDDQISLKGITIDNSGGIGLYAGVNAQFNLISDVLFGDTDSHPIFAPTFITGTVLSENLGNFVFTQQEQNDFQSIGMADNLFGFERLAGRTSFVFEDHGIPYYSYSGFFGNGEIGVQIKPGVEMIMAAGTSIRSGGGVGGRLSVNGTAEAPITLRGAERLAGFWSGIDYRSNSALNTTSNLILSDAVNGVLVNGSASNNIIANITDSSIDNTSECGIRVITPFSSLTFETSGNTYTNNGQGSLGDTACLGNYQE